MMTVGVRVRHLKVTRCSIDLMLWSVFQISSARILRKTQIYWQRLFSSCNDLLTPNVSMVVVDDVEAVSGTASMVVVDDVEAVSGTVSMVVVDDVEAVSGTVVSTVVVHDVEAVSGTVVSTVVIHDVGTVSLSVSMADVHDVQVPMVIALKCRWSCGRRNVHRRASLVVTT